MSWKPMSSEPDEPCGVLYWWPEMIMGAQYGHDHRVTIGFWDGERFREQGTGHDVFEPHVHLAPTKWMPLPDPPKD